MVMLAQRMKKVKRAVSTFGITNERDCLWWANHVNTPAVVPDSPAEGAACANC